jgi:hypothetical protein
MFSPILRAVVPLKEPIMPAVPVAETAPVPVVVATR